MMPFERLLCRGEPQLMHCLIPLGEIRCSCLAWQQGLGGSYLMLVRLHFAHPNALVTTQPTKGDRLWQQKQT
jgi:hypothetical protein